MKVRPSIKVRCEQRTEAITDAGVALQDGTVLPADLVVFATGIRPEVALARDAGLEEPPCPFCERRP